LECSLCAACDGLGHCRYTIAAMGENEPSAEAIEAVLPPDAPVGHEAWKKVIFQNRNKWPLAGFQFGTGQDKVWFQTTIGACGTQELTERVARACYVQFENGLSMEEVKAFRKDCYDKLKDVVKIQDGRGKAPRQASGDSKEMPQKVRASAKSSVLPSGSPPAPTQAVGSPPAGTLAVEPALNISPPAAAEAAADLEDAPFDSDAWTAVKYDKGKACCVMNVKQPDGSSVRFQTTLQASGSQEHSMRIARLCWMKLHAGIPKEEVQEYRKQLYSTSNPPAALDASAPVNPHGKRRHVGDGAEGGAPKKARKSTGIGSALRTLKKEGRLQDALIIEGRDTERKNSSVNGVYALVPGGSAGSNAYEKVGDKRFLYFWTGKSRWKISDQLGDDAKGFAYLQVEDGGAKPPLNAEHPGAAWQVFDGKGEGYGKDFAVSCRRLAGESEGFSSKVMQETGSSSSSDSSSDSDSDAKEALASGDEAAMVPSASPPPTEQAVASNGTHVVLPRPRGMVCAKMLSRSLLRCHCHFQYLRQCPSRGTN